MSNSEKRAMETNVIYEPYIDPDYEFLDERMYPPRVCIDNDTCSHSTLIKVDSANKDGILLEMVQVLTDLDLVISKSYISSDGGWFMDVFHVTDQRGNKLTDESLIHYIQEAICATRRGAPTPTTYTTITSLGRVVRPLQMDTALEMTGTDRPGLMSEIMTALLERGCSVTDSVAWTHNTRVACIVHVENGPEGGPIEDPVQQAQVRDFLQSVVEAHHVKGEKTSVRFTMIPAVGRTHTERRLHQLMYADGDYERCNGCDGALTGTHKISGCDRAHVNIENCEEKGYWILNVRSRDRPKLLFDTVCALTDLGYVVFHAVVASKGTMAEQEYFIRHATERRLNVEDERNKLTLCLIAAIERRISHGLRLDLCSRNRFGLLSYITRVFRESGFSLSRMEVATQNDRAFGSFYVTDASGHDVNLSTVDLAIREIGGSIISIYKTSTSRISSPVLSRSSTSSSSSSHSNSTSLRTATHTRVENVPRFSLGSLLWSQLERVSSSFGGAIRL
ncbi:hypothetical protein CsatA_013793 [Cannabis sativa]